jgi:hypothetical protein
VEAHVVPFIQFELLKFVRGTFSVLQIIESGKLKFAFGLFETLTGAKVFPASPQGFVMNIVA